MKNQEHALKAIADMRSMVAGHVDFNSAPNDSTAQIASFDQGVALYDEVAHDHARTLFALSGLAMALLAVADVETIFAHFDKLEQEYR